MMYYVIDYLEQGVGRLFWYAAGDSPRAIKTAFEMSDEEWDFFSVDVKEYVTYDALADAYSFMPKTLAVPAYMHIRWYGG
ncbi:MAG: hypothetical protein WC965_01425 [Thiohalomonadaceae bacterium]